MSWSRLAVGLTLALVLGLSTQARAEEEEQAERGAQIQTRSIGIPLPPDLPEISKTRALGSKAQQSPVTPPALVAKLDRMFPGGKMRGGLMRGGAELYRKVAPAVCLLAHVEGQHIGTGFFIEFGGRTLVMTNQHVGVDVGHRLLYWEWSAAEQIDPRRPNGSAQVVATNVQNDLAILQTDTPVTSSARIPFGTQADIRKGAETWLVGHPNGELWTITKGIISNITNDYPIQYDDRIQRRFATAILTQTPSNPGASGAPLLTSDGKLIGVNAASKGGAQLQNFAVGLDVVQEFLNAVAQGGGDGGSDGGGGAEELRECPGVLEMEEINLVNQSGEGEGIDLSAFHLVINFKVNPQVLDLAEEYGFIIDTQRMNPQSGEWESIESEPQTGGFPLKWAETELKIPFSWDHNALPAGVYRFVAIVVIPPCATGSEITLRHKVK